MLKQANSTFQVILGNDGSEHAQAAIEFLSNLPVPIKNCITAVAVFSPRQLEKHPMLQEALENTRMVLATKGWTIETELKTGNPAETLLEYAELKHASLIVVGAKGLRATLGILLGGVAQQIVEYGRWPVLIVRAPYQGLKNILVAIDGSNYSRTAIHYLTEFPLPPSITVHLIHVLPPISPTNLAASSMIGGIEPIPTLPPIPSAAETEAWAKEEEERGSSYLAQGQQALASCDFRIRSELIRGDAATEIISYAKRNQIDLIVSGSRGLSPVKGWLLGSVSRKIIHYSGCSILVVRGK